MIKFIVWAYLALIVVFVALALTVGQMFLTAVLDWRIWGVLVVAGLIIWFFSRRTDV